MKNLLLPLFLFVLLFSCKSNVEEENIEPAVVWESYDETADLEEQSRHENERMRFKLINSKVLDKNSIWNAFETDLATFSEEKYNSLKLLILERDISSIQQSIKDNKLSYTDLTLFYIYRIRKFESDNQLSLNAVIALNPDVVEQARELDKAGANVDNHSVYGMPILLKDNIDMAEMATTAGAIAFSENFSGSDAYIVRKLKENNALILGKANLSEWAYYFCSGCPVGYSAVGGQTLNPYGRRIFETGGSSSGSGVAVAANYAVAAVGTETAGSILSPASQNSVVGLKPTVGLLSRTGIVPISGTLDTPGPMTKSVIDNAILLQAMLGHDMADEASVSNDKNFIQAIGSASLNGKRLGVFRALLQDSLYNATVEKIKAAGAIVVEFDAPEVSLDGFLTLLNADMQKDLPTYIRTRAGNNIRFNSVEDLVKYNLEDTLLRAPYGQALFEDVVKDTTSAAELANLKIRLRENGRRFFDEPMEQHQLDAILSINNYHAAYAAVAHYPALTLPIGYETSGEPKNITLITKAFGEDELLKLGFAFEKIFSPRVPPINYQ